MVPLVHTANIRWLRETDFVTFVCTCMLFVPEGIAMFPFFAYANRLEGQKRDKIAGKRENSEIQNALGPARTCVEEKREEKRK